MNQFSISDIENLTRIKAHTLRIWESRYHLFQPKRLPSGHRFYDGEDLKKMLLIASLYYSGYKISQIAAFTEEEIRQKTLVLDAPTVDPEKYLNSLLESSLDLNHEGMAALLKTMVSQLGVERMMSLVIFPFLKKLGLFWLTGHVLPSQEHFASSLLMHCLLREIDALPPTVQTPAQRNIVMFTPQGEQHEIPLLYTYYLLKKNGSSTVYLGKNIALAEIREVCQKMNVTELYFHLITNLTRTDLHTYLQSLEKEAPGVQIFFSGISPEWTRPLPGNVHYLENADAIYAYTRG